MTEINLKRAPFINRTGAVMPTNGAAVNHSLEHGADINRRDWDCLFEAVIERLQFTVSQQFAGEHGAHPGDALAAVMCSVRECLEALAQLQASNIYDRNRPTAIKADEVREQLLLSDALEQVLARNAATQKRAMRERCLLLHDNLIDLRDGSGLATG